MLGIAALCCFHWWLTPSCSRQAGSSATGQGQSSALEWTLKISLPPPSTHLALGPCTLSTLVEGRATSARRCTVSCHITHPCQEHPWALGLHGTKIKAFSSSTNLEKKKKNAMDIQKECSPGTHFWSDFPPNLTPFMSCWKYRL